MGEYHIEFYASLKDAEKQATEPGLGLTKMTFYDTPNVGDEIALSFPSQYLKNNPWFNHIPASPYTIISIFSFNNDTALKMMVYYSGTDNIDFRGIKNRRYK